MKIRKLQYTVDFTHLLTFQTEYRKVIAPFFKTPNLQYGIENIGTLDEEIRLIYPDAHFMIVCNKGTIALVFEGEPKDITVSGNVPITTFSEVLNSLKEIPGFGTISRHYIQIYGVELFDNDNKPKELNDWTKSSFIKFSPFKSNNEFAILFESSEDNVFSKIQFGNYSLKDIAKHDLSPFKTEYNLDLKGNKLGYMANILCNESISSFSKSSFKRLLDFADTILKKISENV